MIRSNRFFASLAVTTCAFIAPIASFSDAPDLDNLLIDFDAPSLGTGASTSPYKYINFAATAANNSATLLIESGTSSERLVGDAALGADSKPLMLVNNTPDSGAVTIGLGSDTPASATTVGHPTLMSPHSSPIISHGDYIYVVNTPADTLDIINASTLEIDLRINVGIDPVSLSVRPDGNEIWVSNHVSDSVSVIDTNSSNATYHQVIATVQDFHPTTKATRFDEPVGIAFASDDKAYVALSSENQIAVIDVATHTVTNHLTITAQDPRSIFVRDGLLYVIPFESQNQTQISGGTLPLDSPYETFDVDLHVIDNNNVLSLGAVVDIVKHPGIPDRDLYIFDTATDTLVDVIDGLGTLLYDLTVDSNGSIYIAQADARNDANGLAGSGNPKHGLAEMDNRAFLNTITNVEHFGGNPPATIVAESASKKVIVPTSAGDIDTGSSFWTDISFNDSTWTSTTGGVGYERSTGFDPLFTLDVETEMFNITGSAFLRIPFNLTSNDIASIGCLNLGVRYDDGFIAYLNGVEVARANGRNTPLWNSRAGANHEDSESVVLEDFSIADHVNDLLVGTNVLAIHAMNITLESSDFLISATLKDGGDCYAQPVFYDLEPLPPLQPSEGDALATPYAIEISDDDSTLVATAAGSDKLFTMNPSTGAILGRVAVGEVPRGIALESNGGGGAPSLAWVLNAVDNTVTLVNVSSPANPYVVDTITLDDPTHPVVKRGRIAFNDANMSSTRTFSCESCHPDGHADQLVWVLNTPIANSIDPIDVNGDPFRVEGDQIQPRVTMPARGLRDTAPYHWDGIPGDPYGGVNAASLRDYFGLPNSNIDINDAASSTLDLVNGGLANTMMEVTDDALNDEGKAGYLSAVERDDMAEFLLNVPYPPAQRRAFDNVLTEQAVEGFELFHIIGQNAEGGNPNICGDCHRMPFWTTTNTLGVNGMDAPTFRGAYDRWLITPQGRQNIIALDSYAYLSSVGVPERTLWGFGTHGGNPFAPVWEMVTEGSTGHSGSFARQVTLNSTTASDADTIDILAALELSASEGTIILQAEGVFIDGGTPTPVELEFDWEYKGGTYVERVETPPYFTRDELLAFADSGQFVGTFTARIGTATDAASPQPAIWTEGPIHMNSSHWDYGSQDFPTISSGTPTMKISARHVVTDALIIVDGRRTSGSISLTESDHYQDSDYDQYAFITLDVIPEAGLHMLQLQIPEGLMSNDFIFFTE